MERLAFVSVTFLLLCRHQDQGNLQKEEVVGAFSFRGLESMTITAGSKGARDGKIGRQTERYRQRKTD